jgi:protease-4
MTPRFTLLGALVAAAAFAQTAAIGGTDLSRGTTLLPGSSAWSDEATSLVYNPAGLGRAGSLNAWFVHERSNVRRMDNDGLWLASGVAGLVGLGVGFEWLRTDGDVDRAKTAVGLSVGPQLLSAGLAVNWFFGGPVQSLVSADVGLQSRPLRWFALAGTVRNLNTPGGLSREWTVGVGLRPLGERLTLGVDWVVPEARALGESRLQYTLAATPVRGLRLLAGASHAFTPGASLYLHAGIGVDLEHFGYTQGVAYADGRLNWQFAARASLDKHGSVLPERKLAVVSLADVGTDGGLTLGSLLGVTEEDKYLRLLRFLERAARDPELAGVVLKVEGSGLGLSRSDEVREAISRLRAAGKKVYAYILSAGDAEYLMVSSCDAIFAAPEAMLILDGLRSTVTFFGGAAKKLGIDVDVARVGPYKTFADQFTRQDLSPEHRETLEAWLDDATAHVAAQVQRGRGLEPAAFQAALDEGLKPPRRAVELRQVDALLTPQQLDEHLREQLPGVRVARGYRPFDERDERWGQRPAIAIVPVLGNITGGKNGSTPLVGQSAGAESFIRALAEAAEDSRVKAIVVRVDSGGGDALASELMYRAVLEAKKKKPVVASMGDVAASGGYYAAMGADEIYASPTTLTGSIGVFYAKPALRRLAEDYGVYQVAIDRGALAGITDLFDPWTEPQREAAQKWIDDFYDSFISEVAASRKLDKARVDAVARGRVWSGRAAQAHGLVDHLGGLLDAVAAAKRRAGVGDDVELVIAQAPSGLLPSLLGAVAPEAVLAHPAPGATPLPPALEALARQLGPVGWLLGPPRVQARLEAAVEIR